MGITQFARCLALSAVLLGELAEARASGLEVADVGTTALGRGNAFVARADDASAFHYNPAGLAKGHGLSLLLSVNVFRLDLDFTRQGSGRVVSIDGRKARDPAFDPNTREPFATVSPSTGGSFGPVPMLVASVGDAFHVKGLAVAVGALPPSTISGRGYPSDGSQRYAAGKAEGAFLYYGAAVAYEITPSLRIGATLLNASAKAKLALPVRPAAMPEDDVLQNENSFEDHTFKLGVADWFIPTASLGLEGQPTSWLDLGLSARLPASIDAQGTLGYAPPENKAFADSYVACGDSRNGSCRGEGRLRLQQRMPWVVRAGARYVGRRFDVELDAIYERWSRADRTTIIPDATFVIVQTGVAPTVIKLAPASLDRGLHDTVTLRLGGDYDLLRDVLTVRAGSFYSPSAYPADNATFNLDVPFATQVGLSVGATYSPSPGFRVSAAYAHIFQSDVRVQQGVVQQLTATDPNRGNVVNNGLYRVALDVFGLSIEGRFL